MPEDELLLVEAGAVEDVDVARVVGVSAGEEIVGIIAGAVVLVGSAVVSGAEEALLSVVATLSSWMKTAPEVLEEDTELVGAGAEEVAGASVAGISVLEGVEAIVLDTVTGVPSMVVVPIAKAAPVSYTPSASSVTVTSSVTMTMSVTTSLLCRCKCGAARTSLASKEEAKTATLEKVVRILFVDSFVSLIVGLVSGDCQVPCRAKVV